MTIFLEGLAIGLLLGALIAAGVVVAFIGYLNVAERGNTRRFEL